MKTVNEISEEIAADKLKKQETEAERLIKMILERGEYWTSIHSPVCSVGHKTHDLEVKEPELVQIAKMYPDIFEIRLEAEWNKQKDFYMFKINLIKEPK